MKASRAVVPSGKNAPSLNRVSSCRLTPSRLFGSIVSQKPLALYSRRLSTPTNAQTQLTHSLSCWVCCPSKISFDTVRKWFNTRAAVNFHFPFPMLPWITGLRKALWQAGRPTRGWLLNVPSTKTPYYEARRRVVSIPQPRLCLGMPSGNSFGEGALPDDLSALIVTLKKTEWRPTEPAVHRYHILLFELVATGQWERDLPKVRFCAFVSV